MTVTVTTNTLGDWFVEPEHAALIDTISTLAEQGCSQKEVAEKLNQQGFVSHTGKAFYAKLVGALISKYRRKAQLRFTTKQTTLVNLDGGWR